MPSAICKRCRDLFPVPDGPLAEKLCPACRKMIRLLDAKGITGAASGPRRRMLDMTEPELRDMFEALAREIQSRLPAGPGSKGEALFCLVVFDEPGVGQYVSNAKRGDCIKSIREFADKLERQQTIER